MQGESIKGGYLAAKHLHNGNAGPSQWTGAVDKGGPAHLDHILRGEI